MEEKKNAGENYIAEAGGCAANSGNNYANILYALRRGKNLTQEQLAEKLSVSAAAVSKWERGISLPDVEMLCAVADYFGVSVDGLLGRETRPEGQLDGLELGMDLLLCIKTARERGLLALEGLIPQFASGNPFLCFAVKLLPELCQVCQLRQEGGIPLMNELLCNYAAALPEAEKKNGRMVAETLIYIMAGEREEIVREVIASHLGMEFRGRFSMFAQYKEKTKEEILERYGRKQLFSGDTNLLEILSDAGALQIQQLLRKLDVITLVAALAGASGAVVVNFLSNLSDQLLLFVDEDIKRFSGGSKEIVEAQRRVLGLAAGLGMLPEA